MTADHPHAVLRAALREVGEAFAALAEGLQLRVDPARDALEAEVDAALLAEDHDRALAAIAAWKRHWLGTFAELEEER